MTTTQPTEFENTYGHRLLVEDDGVKIIFGGIYLKFFFDTPEQAHRASLATLTGPGRASESSLGELGTGFRALRRYVAALDAEAAAEAEAAELDRRAEVAYLGSISHLAGRLTKDWEAVTDDTKGRWVAAVRALDADAEARRLHTNKEARS